MSELRKSTEPEGTPSTYKYDSFEFLTGLLSITKATRCFSPERKRVETSRPFFDTSEIDEAVTTMPRPFSVKSITTVFSSLTSSVENSISKVKPLFSGFNDSGAMFTSIAAPGFIFRALSTHPLRAFQSKPLKVVLYVPLSHFSLSASLFDRPMARSDSSSWFVISSICTDDAAMSAFTSTVVSPFFTLKVALPLTSGVKVTLSDVPLAITFSPIVISLPPLTSAMLTADSVPLGL